MKIAALRALIEEKFPDATPITRRSAQPVASGIPELDRALPNGGFPLGRLSLCEPNGGVTAMLRAACANTVANGERAAWVDGARTIAGAYWGGENVALLVRPTSRIHAVRAADELLRSGAFRLVVLSGVEPEDTESMRLVRAVHDGGGAFAMIAANAMTSALRLSSQFARYRWRLDPFGDPAVVRDVRVRVAVRALGWNGKAEFSLSVQTHDLRLSLEPALADRRGVDRTGSTTGAAAGTRSGSARRNTAHTRAARASAMLSIRSTGRRGYPRAHLG